MSLTPLKFMLPTFTTTTTRIPPSLSVLPPHICTSTNRVLLSHCKKVNFSAGLYSKKLFYRQPIISVKSQLKCSSPLISSDDHWGLWSVLLATGAFGIWSEKTKFGSVISAALVSILVGLAASNLRILPYEAPAYSIVMEYLLPLTIPLLLFRANMRQLIQSTGKLLLAFLIGSVATVIGTFVAFSIVPMRSLGADGWKIAAALMGSYIGGAVNYIAVSEALGVSPSIVAAGVAADNLIYLEECSRLKATDKLPVLPTVTGIAVSFAICKLSSFFATSFGLQGGVLPIATAVVVALATALPQVFTYLAPSGDAISLILMQVFFAVIGASGSVWNVINTAPSIFLFALIQVTVHLAVILGLGKLFQIELKLLLLASNANVGGPTTACGMATAKGWDSLIVPGILAGIFGISIATFLAIGFAVTVLKYM
ncbi:hypothetical protein KSS87_018959 [Heliosperma pusillum]|nr:hypothetical protein KSS87_018959 [Heliosperma pusillum]